MEIRDWHRRFNESRITTISASKPNTCNNRTRLFFHSNDQPHNTNILQAQRIIPVVEPRNMGKGVKGISDSKSGREKKNRKIYNEVVERY